MPSYKKPSYASRVRSQGRRKMQSSSKQRYADRLAGSVASAAAGMAVQAAKEAVRRNFAGSSGAVARVPGVSFGTQTLSRLIKRRSRPSAPAGELTFLTKRGGRMPKMTIPKLMQIGIQKRILRVQGVNRMGQWLTLGAGDIDAAISGIQQGTGEFPLPGFYGLYNQTNAVGTQSFPLMLCDLTCFQNAGVLCNVVHRLQVDDSGLINFQAIGAQNAAGSGTQATASVGNNIWGVEEGATSGANLNNFKYIQTDWYDIRMCCYGARQQPTYYDVMIVRFDNDFLCPSTASTPTRTLEEGYQYRNLWQGLVKNISYNAIMPATPGSFKGMQVLKRFRFTLQASNNDDSDKTPNYKIVKFFYKDGRIRDYAYGNNPLASDTEVNGPVYSTNQGYNATDYNAEPKPRARLYMIVRASNTVPQAVSGADDGVDHNDADVTPSFDLLIRKQIKHQSR